MNRPEENDGLRELKRRWDDGHFAEDRHSVHGVDETLNEVSKRPPRPGWETRDGLLYYDVPRRDVGVDYGGRAKLGLSYQELIDAIPDPAYHKACTVCSKPSRNHHCDACYRMVRDAAEWVADPGRIPSGDDSHPCFICEEGDILSQICGTCMGTILGE